MRFVAIFVLTIAASGAALGEETAADRACIMLSAAQVPSIQGMKIDDARIRPGGTQALKHDPSWKVVEIDVRAVNRNVTFVYDCTLKDGRPTARPAGMK